MATGKKIALVTGAGRGIGQACAVALAQDGFHVIINDCARDGLEETYEQIRSGERTATKRYFDALNGKFCRQNIVDILSCHGHIDVLVHTPSYDVHRSFLEFPGSDFERVIRSTLESTFYLSQQVARDMVSREQGGAIIFISSIQADRPFPDRCATNAAKAGLEQFALSIARELGPHGIRVNVVQPGWTDTPGVRTMYTPEELERGAEKMPLRKLGAPLDVGKAVAFLASGDADHITGAILRVDGGQWLAR